MHRPALATWLAGHALQYVGLMAMGLTANAQFRYVTMGGLVLQAAGALGAMSWRTQARGRLAAVALCTWIAALAVAGYVRMQDGDTWSPYYASDCVVFSVVLGAFMGRELPRVVRLYAWLLPVGLLVAVSMIGSFGAAGIGERFVTDEAEPSVLAGELCAPALFVMLAGGETSKTRLVAMAGCALMALFGLITSTRHLALTPLVALMLRLVVLPRRKEWGKALAVAVLVVAVAALIRWTPEGLEASVAALDERLFDQEDFSSGRNEEAEVFLDVMSDWDVAFGRGLGGSYVGMFIVNSYGINMVHYGALHLMLKGGCLLLGLFLLLALQAVGAGARKGGDALAAAMYVVVYLVQNAGHTQFSSDPGFALAMLAMGAALVGVPAVVPRAAVAVASGPPLQTPLGALRPVIARWVAKRWYGEAPGTPFLTEGCQEGSANPRVARLPSGLTPGERR